MGLFKRAKEAGSAGQAAERADLSTLLLQGEDMIDQLARAHMSWGWDPRTAGISTRRPA
ncbi:hypothetical protein ACO0M4_14205 [Streptomyces sp. RGM 3693]|uniref:hypothetical protein n=1 Tax=Streptomyces sp. RGM 3693 TaxID=3413284 RepID=UPI003D2BD633